MPDPLRLTLFIDAQNAYRRARSLFFPHVVSGRHGQFDPMKLGQLIADRPEPDGSPCSLQAVRVYSGRPISKRDPRTYAAHRRQVRRWEAGGAAVITRNLRYPRSWPAEPAQEKGIDVALATDFVKLAIDGAYDVGVIMSTDTDMLPALEMVRNHDAGRTHVAVAAWGINRHGQHLRLPGLWCHWLDRADYDVVADLTSYSS